MFNSSTTQTLQYSSIDQKYESSLFQFKRNDKPIKNNKNKTKISLQSYDSEKLRDDFSSLSQIDKENENPNKQKFSPRKMRSESHINEETEKFASILSNSSVSISRISIRCNSPTKQNFIDFDPKYLKGVSLILQNNEEKIFKFKKIPKNGVRGLFEFMRNSAERYLKIEDRFLYTLEKTRELEGVKYFQIKSVLKLSNLFEINFEKQNDKKVSLLFFNINSSLLKIKNYSLEESKLFLSLLKKALAKINLDFVIL